MHCHEEQKRVFCPVSVSQLLVHIFFLGIFCFLVPNVHAEGWYVKPSSEVPIRSGQGTEYKILAVVPDGLKVDIIEEQDPWVKVKTPGGNEGWMLKRYLSNDPPLTEMVEILRADKDELAKKEEEVSRRYDELSTAYTQMEQEYNACLVDRDNLRNKYQTLQNDTADVIKIKERLADASSEVEDIRQKMEAVEQQNADLKKNTALKWFMAGGLVLILGWLIGLMTGRSRKKKSSLY